MRDFFEKVPKKRIIEVLIFLALGVVFFLFIHKYPTSLEDSMPYGLTPIVEKVFDGADVSDRITWEWQSMHQHFAGRSPIYAFFIELGLRAFGLTLIGIRIFPAIIAFISLIFAYYVLKKFFPGFFAMIFIVLFATSPWYLVLSRSGGIIGFGMSMTIFSIGMLALTFKNNDQDNWKYYVLSFAAGVVVGILPYGHASLRLVPLALLIWTLIHTKYLGWKKTGLFTLGMVSVWCIQLVNIKNAIKMYFNARGEGLFDIARSMHADDQMGFIIEKFTDNVRITLNYLLGLNRMEEFWSVNIADTNWSGKVVLYPKFLVPFFLIGFIWCVCSLFKHKKTLYFVPIALLGISVMPGLMAGLGCPNQARNFLMCMPLYFFIAYAFYKLYSLAKERLKMVEGGVALKAANIVLMLIITSICIFQIHNFYFYEKCEYDEKHTSTHDLLDRVNHFFEENPESTVAVFEQPQGEYSYVSLRLFGYPYIEDKLKSGQLWLVTGDNHEAINEMIENGEIDIFISLKYPEDLSKFIPSLANITPVVVQYKKHELLEYHIISINSRNGV